MRRSTRPISRATIKDRSRKLPAPPQTRTHFATNIHLAQQVLGLQAFVSGYVLLRNLAASRRVARELIWVKGLMGASRHSAS